LSVLDGSGEDFNEQMIATRVEGHGRARFFFTVATASPSAASSSRVSFAFSFGNRPVTKFPGNSHAFRVNEEAGVRGLVA
jgi:hypothetical protein